MATSSPTALDVATQSGTFSVITRTGSYTVVATSNPASHAQVSGGSKRFDNVDMHIVNNPIEVGHHILFMLPDDDEIKSTSPVSSITPIG